MSEAHHKLAEAPAAVQLAVDLIQLLEENSIDEKVVIDALKIVLHDYEKKAQTK